ncbi:hypothetical protein RN001_011454 [Aquatica leii]|uniref:Uncharacterized protein n=1 Tax=Aquatica leii TaxID=1421715 RepID=A0AAN7PSY7_9COLE|nr:hypothetical protein RN001_011454 [Aquatica leii]
MQNVIQGKSKSQKEKPKIAAINYAIISACRPRSFISPIQLEVGVHLHCKFGSRYLIDVLHSLLVCSSYNEAIGYLNCGQSGGEFKMVLIFASLTK